VDLRDRWVNFRMSSVYHPAPPDLALHLHGGDLLQGKVLGYSDSGTKQRAYVIVKVDLFDDPIILPMEAVLGVL
jgi:hypothetical protein